MRPSKDRSSTSYHPHLFPREDSLIRFEEGVLGPDPFTLFRLGTKQLIQYSLIVYGTVIQHWASRAIALEGDQRWLTANTLEEMLL